MIQSAATSPTATADLPVELRAPSAPRLWGLGALQLHEAFWHAHGVQCVVRGQRAPLQRAAELYLLIEPGQLVLFDVAAISDRLTWHGALMTRLRLIDDDGDPYSEHVVLDRQGLVERIERRYRPSGRAHRVMVTSRRRLAAMWMAAPSARDGWRRMRRAVPWSRIDHGKIAGTVLWAGDDAQQRRFVDRVIDCWGQPDQSIDGITCTGGIWHAAGDAPPEAAVRIAPLWLGCGAARDDRRCLVGPEWVADETHAVAASAQPAPVPVSVRRIAEVALPEDRRRPVRDERGRVYLAAKRAMDVAASGAGLVISSPVLLLIALLIMLEDGRPVLFGHRRQGRGGRPFTCWKFRTMHRDAEKIARELEAYNVCDGPQVYIQDDPRVTRVGRLLRGTHFDELPQLWNVLVGQMSLVGPRPSPDDENQFCPAWRDSRLSVRPGITGLWQLERTREPGEDFQEWIRYDIEYVQRASFWLDLVILARTARILLLGRPDRASE